MLASDRARWHDEAACRGKDPAVFYPGRGDGIAVATAKAICAGCPVSGECLAFALANRQVFGIWGGTSERQRRQLRRRMTVTPAERAAG